MPTIALQTRAAEFKEALGKRVLVADGAMGTALYAKGVFINRCYDELNLSLPALVRDVHQEYVKAGAEILETNTFGANRKRLAAFGFAEKVRLINQAGVRIAREAARELAFVAGAVGPLGIRLEPLGPTSFEEARAIVSRTDRSAGRSRRRSAGARNLSRHRTKCAKRFSRRAKPPAPDIAIIAQLSIEDDGSLRDGTSTEDFTLQLDEWPVDVIGLNCSSGPKVMLETIEKMVAYTTKPLSAMPNAGLPTTVEGRNIYLCSPEYMAQYARRFLLAGVQNRRRLLRHHGGAHQGNSKPKRAACSTSSTRRPRWWKSRRRRPKALEKVPVAEKSALGAKLAAGKFVAFVEILPPRGVDASKEIEGAKLCKAAGIDCINVPDGPRASARMSAQVTCQLIQQQAEIEAVMHFCCRDRNILSIQSELLGAYAVGVRNLICITGDPPRMGTYPDATAVFDVDAIGLANIVNNLNHGLDLGGNPMGSQTALLIGVGANPGALNMDEEIRRFEWKVKAGAEYIVTQPVFDLDLLEAFLKTHRAVRLPVIAGIWPLTSFRNAEFMVNELRVPVPEEYMERMRARKTPKRRAPKASPSRARWWSGCGRWWRACN